MSSQASPPFAVFDDYQPTVSFAVLVRWVLLVAWFFVLHYRVEYDGIWLVLTLMSVALAALNAYMTWLIVTGRPINQHLAVGLSVADLTVITVVFFCGVGSRTPITVSITRRCWASPWYLPRGWRSPYHRWQSRCTLRCRSPYRRP